MTQEDRDPERVGMSSASKVAIVTGASRGIGKGIALGLGEAGWTLYLTSRTVRDGESDRPGSISSTAEEVTRLGGRGIPVRCDHNVDDDTEAVFDRVMAEAGRLDLLVNNATNYTLDIGPPEDTAFWEQPFEVWDRMQAVGLRSSFVASVCAARIMVRQRNGLIVNISSAGAVMYTGHVGYNVVKAGIDMLTLATAQELYKSGVAVVSVWPRMTRTEAVMRHTELYPDPSRAWTPAFNGRVVAALAADPDILARSGRAFDIGDLSNDYGIDDVDGRRPAQRTFERQVGVRTGDT
jgi:dehydrogenase/reductase SDR family protein 1